MNPRQTPGVGGAVLRAVIYGALLAAAALALGLEQPVAGRLHHYSDYGLTERLQDLALHLNIACFGLVAAISRRERPLAILFAGLCLAAQIREWDFFLDDVWGPLWNVLVALVLAVTTALAWRLRAGFTAAVHRFTGQPAFGLVLAGFLVVGVFARLFGTGDLWHHLLGEGYARSAKNLAQEGAELLGYTLVLCAALEYLWQTLLTRRRRPASW